MSSATAISRGLGNVGRYTILGVFALIFAFPFYYVFVMATLPTDEIFMFPPKLVFGTALVGNWIDLQDRVPFIMGFVNSLGIAVLSTIGQILFCTLGAFAIAKYEFRFKKTISTLLLILMAIPGFLAIIPFYKMMAGFGWLGGWLPLIVPGLANAFGIFFLTQYLKDAIPTDLMCAARIDGVSEYKMLWHVVLPLARPAIGVFAIITFVSKWNDFFGPVVFLPKMDATTIPVMLSLLFGRSNNGAGALMLGNALALLPLILVFLIFSRQIISGLTAGAIKH